MAARSAAWVAGIMWSRSPWMSMYAVFGVNPQQVGVDQSVLLGRMMSTLVLLLLVGIPLFGALVGLGWLIDKMRRAGDLQMYGQRHERFEPGLRTCVGGALQAFVGHLPEGRVAGQGIGQAPMATADEVFGLQAADVTITVKWLAALRPRSQDLVAAGPPARC